MSHPNIIKLREAIETTRQVNIVLEYVPGLTLHQYLKTKQGRKLSEIEAKKYFRYIVDGLRYCHERFVAHR